MLHKVKKPLAVLLSVLILFNPAISAAYDERARTGIQSALRGLQNATETVERMQNALQGST